MAKRDVGKRWSHLTGYDKTKDFKPPKVDTETADDPSQGLMDMMKKMYEEGDDELKRTIAKAWTESRDKQMGF